jgi:hypothetical protein
MESRRWINQTQPQTLQIAVFLLYFNGIFALLFGGLFSVWGLAFAAGCIGAGYGIANERKWGYGLGVGVALFPFVLLLSGQARVNIISLLFDVALVALLLHPQSRDYQRIWFK